MSTGSGNRANMNAYTRWHFEDFALERGVGFLFFAVLIGGQAYLGARASGFVEDVTSRMLAGLITSFIPFFTLFAVNRIISGDRVAGYYRLLFSKPVHIADYYSRRFVVNGVAMFLVMAAMFAVLDLAGVNVLFWDLMAYSAIVFVLLGALLFWASSFTKHDWAIAAVLWYGSGPLREYYDDGMLGKVLNVLLPPMHLLDRLKYSLFGRWGQPPAESVGAQEIFWLLGYGLLFLAMGLYIVRKKPLAA